MDCKDARLLLAFAHPRGELDAPDAAALEQHLQECPHCQELAQGEQRFDDAIGQAMRAVEPPEGMHMRLLARLDKERDAWYRRFAVRTIAAAAAVLLVAFSGWLWLNRPVSFDVQQVQNDANDQYRALYEDVDAWVKREGGSHLAAPADFDYRYFVDAHMAEFQGRRVPVLLFVRSATTAEVARVYVLSDREFDLETIHQQHIAPGSGINIRRLSDPSRRILYFVLHNSSDFDKFLSPDRQPAA